MNDKQLKKLIEENDLVTGMVDPTIQIQSNGVEFTVKEIYGFEGAGVIAFDNSERTLPSVTKIDCSGSGHYYLPKGCYRVDLNEKVKIPADVCAFARARSSLLRMGVSVETALFDSGYEGKSQVLLVVYNEFGLYIKKNARIIQLVFLKGESDADKLYSGIYQRENL